MTYYLGRTIQLIALVELVVGLMIGFLDKEALHQELTLLGIGVFLFLVGRVIEKKGI